MGHAVVRAQTVGANLDAGRAWSGKLATLQVDPHAEEGPCFLISEAFQQGAHQSLDLSDEEAERRTRLRRLLPRACLYRGEQSRGDRVHGLAGQDVERPVEIAPRLPRVDPREADRRSVLALDDPPVAG